MSSKTLFEHDFQIDSGIRPAVAHHKTQMRSPHLNESRSRRDGPARPGDKSEIALQAEIMQNRQLQFKNRF